MSGNVNANVSADIAQFMAAMQQAAAQMNTFASTVASASAQAQASMGAMGTATQNATNNMRTGFTNAGGAAGTLGGRLANLGMSADFAARKLSAVIDESLAGRWRQFDGTVASIVTRIIAANAALGGMIVAAAAATAAVGYLAYSWIQTANAIKQAENNMILMGTHGSDAIARIKGQLTDLTDNWNLWQNQANKVVDTVSGMPPVFDQFADRVNHLAVAFHDMTGESFDKTLEKIKAAGQHGAEGLLKLAEGTGALEGKTTASGESLKKHIETEIEAGRQSNAVNDILKALETQFVNYAAEVRKSDQAMRDWILTNAAITAQGGQAVGPPPERPKPPEIKVDVHAAELTATQDRLNRSLQERDKYTQELAQAQELLNNAEKSGDPDRIARATEAVATAQKHLNEIHTTTEETAHRATQAQIEEGEAAAKTAREKVTYAKQALDEALKYYHEGSAEEVAARKAVSEAEKSAATEDYRIQSLKYEQQIAAAKGNLGAQKKIYDEWLAYAKTIYPQESTEYQQILLKETEAMHRHTAAGVDMKKEELRQEIAAAQGNFTEMLRLEDQLLEYLKTKYGERSREYQREALHRVEIARQEQKEEAAIAADAARTQQSIERSQERMAQRLREFQTGGTKMSLLDLLGFSQADTKAFEEQLNQITEAHAEAMAAIKKQQEAAVNDREMKTALDAEKKELQSFAEEEQKVQLQMASATKKAWESVTDSLASEIGTSFTKMVTGQQTALRSLGSIIEQMINKVATWSLKMVGRWIIDRMVELHTSQAVEAGKTAATAGGTAARSGIQAAANAKDNLGFFGRLIKWILTELGMTDATTTGATARTGEQATADATTKAEAATTAVSQAESNVGVAATGAAASVAAIPIVGWTMAPEVAASTAAALQPFVTMAALDVGAWDIPRDMIAQIHRNEMVVPADFASGLRGQLSGTGPANPIALNFSPNISMAGGDGISRNSVQTIMSMASAQMYGYVRNVFRNGTVVLPGSRLA